MKQCLCFLLICLSGAVARAQEARFDVEVSTDSVLLGNAIEVRFTLKNAPGRQFQAPAFRQFDVVGGPNQSSSFSMVNGVVTQSATFSYYLEPREVGTFFIEPASIQAGEKTLETQPVKIQVYPNPGGVRQPTQQRDRTTAFPNGGLPAPGPGKDIPAKKKERKTMRL